MSQEISEMARQAGFNVFEQIVLDDMGYVTITKRLEAFAKLVAAKEREACAKVCDEQPYRAASAQKAAQSIRARSNA